MAAKKQKNNSINLLKGITGSRLAKIIVVIAIVLTIPVTVLMSQKQQTTQQEAATATCPDRYGNTYGGCFDTTKYACSQSFLSGRCYGATNIKCCQATAISRCVDVNKYICSGGYFQTGKCSGGYNIKYCTGYPKLSLNVPCSQYTNPTSGKTGSCINSKTLKCSKTISNATGCGSGYICCGGTVSTR
ncbi:hypothetical protein M1349_00895 [Patescibacteria group bacterium]|nr:hypothetical protein [Patescibacteria group bacterium]